MKRSRRMGRPFACALAALLLLAAPPLSHAEGILPGDHQPLPDIRWEDENGTTHHLKDTHGKPRLLHFWAAWCAPCHEEMPGMLKWQEENDDILVIPLSLDQRIAQTKHFIKKNNLAMPALLIDQDDSNALGIPVVPYTILVSADGLFAGHLYGMAPWADHGFADQVRQQFAAGEPR